jgi:CRP/FNR family cyclic AMP-dependent transcriptional regulator
MKTMDALEDLLTKHPFLTGLKEEVRDLFGDCATLRRFASNQQIFQEGGEADHFYLIISGKVALETFVPGLGMVTIQSLGPGDALGWSWLFPPHQWHFTASTQAPTEVISLDAAQLRYKAEENREFRDELLTRISKTLLERLLATRVQLIDVYAMRP